MPTVVITLEETDKSIFSSVYNVIIADIADVIKLPSDTLTSVFKDQEVTLTNNRPTSSVLDDPNRPVTVTKRKIEARVTENYNEDDLTSTPVGQNEYYPIFNDTDIGVYVAPVYVMTDVEIEFSYKTPSRAEAKRLRDDIRLRLSQHRDTTIHNVDYNIIVPEIIEDFISDVHEIKKRLYPSELGDYFKKHSTNRVHSVTDMSNASNVKLAVSERQVRIIGLFDFNSMPEKAEVEREDSTYELKFNYKFTFSAPKAMSIHYPVMFCNQVMPYKYVEFIEKNRLRHLREFNQNSNYIGRSMHSLSHFEAHRQMENRVDTNANIPVPLFDDFILRVGHKGYAVAVSVLPEVDETDKKSLFNLTDIDPYYFSDTILRYLREGEHQYITTPYASFMYLGAHQDMRYFDAPLLEMDGDLNIKSKREIDLTRALRVTLSFSFDISRLTENCIDRLKLNPDVLLIFVAEYISAYNSNKNEVDYRATDNNFLSFIIRTIYEYRNKDWMLYVRAILLIISKDKYLSDLVFKALGYGYPELHDLLVADGILDPLGKYKEGLSLPPYEGLPGSTSGSGNSSNPTAGDTYPDEPNKILPLEVIKDLENKLPGLPLEADSRFKLERMNMRTVMTGKVTALRMKDILN